MTLLQSVYTEYSEIATIIAAVIAIIALLYTAYEVRKNSLTNRAKFWLQFEEMFRKHDSIHIKLRPGGIWTKNNSGPQTVEEWAAVEDYMGLLELCEKMMENDNIDVTTFKELYGYRVDNIIANDIIKTGKLVNEREYWENFIKLTKRMKPK